LLVPLLFVAVLRSGPTPAPLFRSVLPQESYDATRCTWYCHNHGCRHRPVLPEVLSGDHGLFGWTIHALQSGGRAMSPGAPGLGYGAANLVVFCAVWPAAMLGLWVLAVRQRRQIRMLRGQQRP